MATTLTAIIFAIVLWIVVQLAIGANATAAKEERDDWCLANGVSTFECDATYESREGVR